MLPLVFVFIQNGFTPLKRAEEFRQQEIAKILKSDNYAQDSSDSVSTVFIKFDEREELW